MGSAHVDERPPAVARGNLVGGVGQYPRAGDDRAHHRRWRHALELPHRAVRLTPAPAPVVNVMGEETSENVLGMMIDEKLEVPGAESAAKPPSGFGLGDLQTVQRLSNLVNTTTSARDKYVIDEFEHLVVRLPAKGYGMTEFDMTDERRALLVDAGRQAMKNYFAPPVHLESDISFGMGESAGTAEVLQTADKVALKILECLAWRNVWHHRARPSSLCWRWPSVSILMMFYDGLIVGFNRPSTATPSRSWVGTPDLARAEGYKRQFRPKPAPAAG